MLGIDEGSEDDLKDGVKGGWLLGFELHISEGSEDGIVDGRVKLGINKGLKTAL